MARFFLTFIAVFAFAGAVHAAPDDDFLAAREAFRVGDAIRLERAARSLADYPLWPYVEYWRLKLRLEDAAPEEVQALLARLNGMVVGERLRADWAKVLGMKQRWDLFDAAYAELAASGDTELSCFAQQSQLRTDTEAAMLVAARLQSRLNRFFGDSGVGPVPATLSIGVAEIADTRSLDALLARADVALYAAKRAGRNCVRSYA